MAGCKQLRLVSVLSLGEIIQGLLDKKYWIQAPTIISSPVPLK